MVRLEEQILICLMCELATGRYWKVFTFTSDPKKNTKVAAWGVPPRMKLLPEESTKDDRPTQLHF